MSNTKVYPLADGYRHSLRTCDALIVAHRVTRSVMDVLKISSTEVEVLIVLASSKLSKSFVSIREELDYLTSERLQRLLSKMVKSGIIFKSICPETDQLHYTVSHQSLEALKTA
jgi:DNA-binding HxlR family transcriptional regulator